MTAALHFDHPWRIAGGATFTFVVASAIAAQDPLSQRELDLTTWINSAPDWAATVLYPIMQLGTVIAPIGFAIAVVVWKRDWWTAAASLVGGIVTWFAAKGVKEIVQRGRPLQYLPDIHVREGSGTGLGFISGHSAVAACTAIIAMTVLPRRWRPVLVLLPFLVGLGRIVHGVHLPADVIGGWAFGVLTGLGSVELFGRLRDRFARRAGATA